MHESVSVEEECLPRTTSDHVALLRLIAAHPFVSGMKAGHVSMLASFAMLTEFQRDELIFREGDVANRFHIIRQGSVLLESRDDFQAPAAVQRIGAGDVLGWSWLFPPYYWNFDARAAEPTAAIFFYGTRLREQCEQDPEFGYEVMKRVSDIAIRRLQETRRHLLAAARTGASGSRRQR